MNPLFPHIQQGIGVQCEGADVVEQHDPHGERLPAAVGQHRIDIGCIASALSASPVEHSMHAVCSQCDISL